jgi:DNA replication protein DnaC
MKFVADCPIHGPTNLSDEDNQALQGLRDSDLTAHRQVIQCPKCDKEIADAKRMAEASKDIAKRKQNSNIPPRFMDASSITFIAKDKGRKSAKTIAMDYISNFGNKLKLGSGMIFAGPPGTGKTLLACVIINGVIEGGNSALYTTGLELKQSIQSTYSDQGKTRQEVKNRYIACNLLVIDEVDLIHVSDDAQLILWEVISTRYNLVKPTILISNLNKQQLTEAIGDRIIDRMRENGGKFVAFTWESHRRMGD